MIKYELFVEGKDGFVCIVVVYWYIFLKYVGLGSGGILYLIIIGCKMVEVIVV